MKKKVKSLTSIGLALMVLAGVLSACSSSKDSGSAKNTPVASTIASPNESNLKPYEITMAFITVGSQNQGIPAVQEEINKIIKPKLNATVKLVPISYGSWSQQMNLMMVGNEKLDLLVSGMGTYNTQVAQGQLIPLDDLITKHGSGITSALAPEIIKTAQIKGKVYGVPSNRDLASDYGIVMRKDLVDKYKIDLTAVKSMDDLDAIFKTIKAGEQNIIPLVSYVPGATPIDSIAPMKFDILDDKMGVLPNSSNELKVVNMFESDEYTQLIQTVRRWYSAGYIRKDEATSKDNATDLIKANRAFSFFTSMKPGYEEQATRASGTQMVAVRFSDPITTTKNITNFMWSIAKNSKDPDRAMMLLNLMYSDKQIINLLDYGIEGKDYVKVSENLIEYPSGVNASNVSYGLNLGWLFGNQFLSYVFKPDSEDIWKRTDEFNKSSNKSKALGFSFDVLPVKTESAALANVLNQYKIGLETGTLDPDKNLPEFNKALKDAGLDKVIAEKQKQLTEWASTKK